MTYTVYLGYEGANTPSVDVFDALDDEPQWTMSVGRDLDGSEAVVFGEQHAVNAVHALMEFRDRVQPLLAKYGHRGKPSVLTVRLSDPDGEGMITDGT